MRTRGLQTAATLLVAVGVFAGCDGGGGGDNGVGPTPSIQITVAPATIAVQQGASTDVTVTLVRSNFTADVAVSVEGLPAGLTVSVVPATLSGSTPSAVVTLSASASVVPASYPLVVRASATGVGSATADVTVTVTATPNFSVAVAPAALTVQAGATGSATVTLTRTNFTGEVALALDAPPAGITGTFTPASVTATTSALVVSVAANVAAGSYSLTIKGSGTGVGDRTATLALTVTAVSDFSLAVTPAALTLAQGANGSASIAITRTNFTGTVALSLDAPPAGITGTFTPANVPGTASTLVVSVAANVAAGSYPLTIKGSGTGIGDRTTTLTLTVTVAAGSIVITVTPQAAAVSQGGTGEAVIDIARTNVAGAVTFTTSGVPAGVTVAFDQNPTTLSQVRMTYSVAAGAAIGTYPIVIAAQATGVPTAQGSFSLQVTASSSSQVEFQFCSASENPVFFGARDGSGAWQVVNATLAGGVYRYRFSLTQNVGGVFYVQLSAGLVSARQALGTRPRSGRYSTRLLPDALARRSPKVMPATAQTDYETTVLYATAAELASIGLQTCETTLPTKSVFLQVAGVGNGQQATLSLGGATEIFVGLIGVSPVEFVGVRTGTVDFFGVRASMLTGVPNKIYDVRGLNPADGSTLPFTADFNSVDAYDPASAQLTVGNALGDDLITFGSFYTANGEVGLIGSALAPSTATARTWYGVPANKLVGGDVHANMVLASPDLTSSGESRYHFAFTTTVQDIVQTLGARLPTPSVSSVGTTSYRRLRVQGALPSEYNTIVSADFGAMGGGNEVYLTATNAYLAVVGSVASYDLTIPDLTALAGFPLASTLPAGEIETLVNATGWSGLGTLSPLPSDGVTFRGATKQVSLVVP